MAFLHHEVVVEDVDALEQDVVTVGQDVLPVVVAGGVHGGLHQLEVLGVAVGHDVEVVAVMADVVLQIALALLDDLPLAVGGVGIEVPPLRADGGAGANDEVLLAFGFADAAREGLVLFFKHQHVFADVGAQDVLVNLE